MPQLFENLHYAIFASGGGARRIVNYTVHGRFNKKLYVVKSRARRTYVYFVQTQVKGLRIPWCIRLGIKRI
jgi:hypothetical protein